MNTLKDSTFVVSLMTKSLQSWEEIKIGFRIFKLKSRKRFFQNSASAVHVADSGNLEFIPQVTKRFQLKPGKYVIIPFTEYSNQESEFLLRVFSEKPTDLQLLV